MDIAGKTLSDVVSTMGSFDNTVTSAWESAGLSGGITTIDVRGQGEVENDFALLLLVSSKQSTPDAVSFFLECRRKYFQRLRTQNVVEEYNVPAQRSKFDDQHSSLSIRWGNRHGVTPLHMAIYRNTIHVEKIIQLLIEHDQNETTGPIGNVINSLNAMISLPMACGSYPLHVLTGQNATINEKALGILVHANPKVISIEDINGDNPISLLWKNTLRFRWAISIMEGAPLIDYIDKKNTSSWMAITTPYKYIECTLTMVRAFYGRESLTFHDLCALPRCPPLLMILSMLPEYNLDVGVEGSVFSLDEDGKLPLHYAVQSVPVNYKCVPDYLQPSYHWSLVSLLLDKYPDSVAVKDNCGRLPLHYALENGCMRENDLMRLVDLYPASLKEQDPVSGLYPFMLVAHSQGPSVPSPDIMRLFHPLPHPLANNFQAEDDSDLEHLMEWKKDHVRISFLLLSLCPEALQYHQREGLGGVDT
ncbi:ankyrin repeat domain protein [Nitzschia inconspicua]|uniref:Ankyrin repeat domain protein n=1 Tax=Nitzschia inconspicua TaxID=303405 RepID=A0A9K3KIU4_9STRA|nr:ankyrin repeat domain protein [Nitzschia inconspicua]